MEKDFPRLPVILLCDSLYAGESLFDIRQKYHWAYIIRYKERSIPSVMKEYEMIFEKRYGKNRVCQ